MITWCRPDVNRHKPVAIWNTLNIQLHQLYPGTANHLSQNWRMFNVCNLHKSVFFLLVYIGVVLFCLGWWIGWSAMLLESKNIHCKACVQWSITSLCIPSKDWSVASSTCYLTLHENRTHTGCIAQTELNNCAPQHWWSVNVQHCQDVTAAAAHNHMTRYGPLF